MLEKVTFDVSVRLFLREDTPELLSKARLAPDQLVAFSFLEALKHDSVLQRVLSGLAAPN